MHNQLEFRKKLKTFYDADKTPRKELVAEFGYSTTSASAAIANLVEGHSLPSREAYQKMLRRWPGLNGTLDIKLLRAKPRRTPRALPAAPAKPAATPKPVAAPKRAQVDDFDLCSLAVTLAKDPAAPRWLELIEEAISGRLERVLQFLKAAVATEVRHGV